MRDLLIGFFGGIACAIAVAGLWGFYLIIQIHDEEKRAG